MKSLDAECRNELGISAVQLTALMVISESDSCLMSELASTLMIDKSAVTGLANRMLAADLIVKGKCAEDSRATRLSVTSKGNELLLQGLSQLDAVNARISGDFTDQELDTVERFLDHIATSFSHTE